MLISFEIRKSRASWGSIFASPGKCRLLESNFQSVPPRVPTQQCDIPDTLGTPETFISTFYISRVQVYRIYYLVNFLVRRAEQALDAVGVVVAFPFLDIPRTNTQICISIELELVFIFLFFNGALLYVRIQLQDLDRNFFFITHTRCFVLETNKINSTSTLVCRKCSALYT